ncbi:hypothetical protein [Laspinema olomoucense]|uniref:Uncharacterized protein n=1 Tax=Laspinema olomoucense D3b TaxID=2953688 RepID=A0ABT2NEF6_9CYAN|nr:hypothetical protein [Laspinema sp. D3b]MCT7981079.1 hypothetical protein [Laspinema sp. D3b]
MSKLQLILLTQPGFIFSVNFQPTLTQWQNYSDELADDTPLVYPDPLYEPTPEDIMVNFWEASRYH